MVLVFHGAFWTARGHPYCVHILLLCSLPVQVQLCSCPVLYLVVAAVDDCDQPRLVVPAHHQLAQQQQDERSLKEQASDLN